MYIPYKHLTLFVIGILFAVFLGIIITEKFLSSSAFEEREISYNCLVGYLADKNITDEYFTSVDHNIDDLDGNVNCSVILAQFNILEDIKSNLYSSYNITPNLCGELMTDKELCPSSNDGKGSDNQSKSEAPCYNKTYFTEENIGNLETVESLDISNKKYCTNAKNCFECIQKVLLGNNDYENVILHAKAVNYTIVQFNFWIYFELSSRVNQILHAAHTMEGDALRDCTKKSKCASSVILSKH